MIVAPMQPVVLDVDAIAHVRVTLEKPFRGGGLRFRFGTTDPKKNLAFDANDPQGDPPFFPGHPIIYPEDGPAEAGTDHDTWIMPPVAAFQCFGHFYAPLAVPRGGIEGFTLASEKLRIAMFWWNYRMPKNAPSGERQPINRLGPPEVPHVALRFLDKRLKLMADANGGELVIRPRAFFTYDDMAQYDVMPEWEEGVSQGNLMTLLQQLSSEDIVRLIGMVKSGKT